MGNALRFLWGTCCKQQQDAHSSSPGGKHGVSPLRSTGVSSLAHDLFTFQITTQVPENLQNHVVSSQKAQLKWYSKLLDAWTDSNPPPETPDEAAKLVIDTLKKHHRSDVEGLLHYYGLPLPLSFEISSQGLLFELQTLPVDGKAVADGDTVTVYVSIKDAREAPLVPRVVLDSAAARTKARARKDYEKSDTLHQNIVDAGYRVLNVEGEEIIARKYRIRLRGIDAPENSMPYGKESKQGLCNLIQGKRLRVLVYKEDRYKRYVGDIYSNGLFVQEVMLKKGFAWHYKSYDNRDELSKWEKQAREKRIGLWAASNPKKPWEWRKNKRNEMDGPFDRRGRHHRPKITACVLPSWAVGRAGLRRLSRRP